MPETRLFEPEAPNLRATPWSKRGQDARWRQTAYQDVRGTPKALFDALDVEFGFTVDVAALPENALCPRYFTPELDGLRQSWAGERCWMNPPYSELDHWAAKAAAEARGGACLVVGLLPVRTDLGWFHDHVLGEDAEVRFIRGRVRFNASGVDSETYPIRSNAPFASMIVVWSDASVSSEGE